MLDDDDPLFARVRAARPEAPATLEHDVIAKLSRPSRRPVIVGTIVAVAAIACIVLLVRRGDAPEEPLPDARIVSIPVDAPERAAPPIDAALPSATWADLSSIWRVIEQHRAAIAACPARPSKVVIQIHRSSDGTAFVLDSSVTQFKVPPPGARCRWDVIRSIELPPVPEALDTIVLVMEFPVVASTKTAAGWNDPLATIERHFAGLAVCVRETVSPRITLERTPRHNPRIEITANQFLGKHGAEEEACLTKVLNKLPLPTLPPHISSITVRHLIKK